MVKFVFRVLTSLGVVLLSNFQAIAGIYGTGFVFRSDGYLITTNEIVTYQRTAYDGKKYSSRCGKVTVKIRNTVAVAQVVARDIPNNLAVLKVNPSSFSGAMSYLKAPRQNIKKSVRRGWTNLNDFYSFNVSEANSSVLPNDGKSHGMAHIRLSRYQARPGTKINLLGYPLSRSVSTPLKITSGVIVSNTGPGNNSTLIQIDAASNGGSGGSPVINGFGDVVAIYQHGIEKYRNGDKYYDAEGFNFALKSHIIKQFLDSHGIDYDTTKNVNYTSSRNVYEMALNSVAAIGCTR